MAERYLLLATLLEWGLNIYLWMIFIRVAISWLNLEHRHPVVEFIDRITEPLLAPIRRLLPPMPIDFSPVVASFLIIMLKNFLVHRLILVG